MASGALAINGHHASIGPLCSRFHGEGAGTRNRRVWPFASCGLSCCFVLAGGLLWAGKYFEKAPFHGPTWTVAKEILKVAIVERGTIESARNGDIICTVRSGTKGSTIATTIKWIIEPGVQVAKGDKLVELDSSGFVE
jgi:hypothetical protein